MASRTKRVLPQVPKARPLSAPGSKRTNENDAGDVVTLMSQSSVKEAGSRISSSPPGVLPKREFVSPVKFAPGGGEDSSVVVAVRVRPFSEREVRLGAKQIVRMHGNETMITSKDGVLHRFYYDHCFWSFDREVDHTHFAGQERVYKELAQPLLDSSFQGFNTCLFAYGQTGSGKSYCIMGEREEQGIVPQFSKELYDRIQGTSDNQTTFNVQVSYYEIYNERIYDLLASNKQKSKIKLRVREHPVMGPYVEDLSTYVATSYSDIEHWINLGNRFRATAATGMNDRSSRSHSVFTIMLTQTSVLEGEEHSKVSRINLIDLAGSERSSVANTTGERLREGANINRSLHTLGKVISLLSERSTGKRKKVYIPYRDSTLSWLLKDSLGGNSKTAMIATISPAHLHHEESLSTLRYAQQARTIVNVARINEDPNVAIIKDLRQEIEFLRTLLGQGVDPSASISEIRELRDKLRESEKLVQEASRSWQEKLEDTEARRHEEMEQLKKAGIYKIDNRLPNLVNLNEDPQLSEMLLYVLKEGMTSVGPSSSHDIQLTGALVTNNHCSMLYQDGAVTIDPSQNSDAQTFVNGTLIAQPTVLHHGDRVVVGGDHFFRLNHPLEVERGAGGGGGGKRGFEFARDELVKTQTARLEAELEEKRLREREQLMSEIQMMKEAAQMEMDRQRGDYEDKLKELESQMEEQSLEVTIQQQSKEEVESKMEELARKTRELEEETMAQRHIIHLEKLKTEKEYTEMKEQKSHLMMELESEKKKLESDIAKFNKNKHLRQKLPHSESGTSISSITSDPGLMRGSELVRFSMRLQEATAICKNLNKPFTFSREETYENGEPEVRVRVNNTQLGLVTYWDLTKFETRLEQMRDAYQSAHLGSVTSLETDSIGSGTSEDVDPFRDSSDTWVKDTLLTPHTSPHRTAQLRRSFLSSGSPALNSPSLSALKPTSLPRSLVEYFSNSRGASPGLVTPDVDLVRRSSYHQLTQSLPRVCSDHISRILALKEGEGLQESLYQRVLSHVWKVKAASIVLEEAFDRHAPTPDLNVPFSETTEVRLHTVSLYTSLELLLEAAMSLQEQCSVFESLMGSGRSIVEQSCGQLVSTISHQTALYCSRLLQGIDNEVEETIRESQQGLHESLDSVTCLTGQLSLARRAQEKVVGGRLHPGEECGIGGSNGWEDFLSLQPFQKSAAMFYQGYCEWSVMAIENTSFLIQDNLKAINQATPSTAEPQSYVSELVSCVCRVMSTALSFLQRLAEMQAVIWNLENLSLDEGTLPVTPNVNHVVDMLVHLQQVQITMSKIHCETICILEGNVNLEKLAMCHGHIAVGCNGLAASVLTVIKNSACAAAQELSVEVQSLSHEIARAGKALNHRIKKGPSNERSGKHHKRPSSTSLATGQVTHSPSPPTLDDGAFVV